LTGDNYSKSNVLRGVFRRFISFQAPFRVWFAWRRKNSLF